MAVVQSVSPTCEKGSVASSSSTRTTTLATSVHSTTSDPTRGILDGDALHSIFALTLGLSCGSPLHIAGLTKQTTLNELCARVARELDSCASQVSLVREMIALTAEDLPKTLEELCIDAHVELTCVLLPFDAVFDRRYEYIPEEILQTGVEKFYHSARVCFECDGRCLLIVHEDDRFSAPSGCCPRYDLAWSVLAGTFRLDLQEESTVAVCSWRQHFERKFHQEAANSTSPTYSPHRCANENETDSGWVEMAEQASFKWRRIYLSGSGDEHEWRRLEVGTSISTDQDRILGLPIGGRLRLHHEVHIDPRTLELLELLSYPFEADRVVEPPLDPASVTLGGGDAKLPLAVPYPQPLVEPPLHPASVTLTSSHLRSRSK